MFFCDIGAVLSDTTQTPSPPQTQDPQISDTTTTKDSETSVSRESRDLKPGTMEEMANQLISVLKPSESKATLMEKPTRGEAATAIINPGKRSNINKIEKPSTVRPVGAATETNPTDSPNEGKESYLPLYACDDISGPATNIEPLYKGCVHGCQMREPVKVTQIRIQAPKPYHEKLEVIWYSATQMYDVCHEDIWGGEHRMKSAIEYPLSDEEISKIYNEVKDHLVNDQDLIHGDYPRAECSYWQDNKDQSIMTRIRKSLYDLYWAPEVNDYYIHIPSEQVNVLMWDEGFRGPTGIYKWKKKNLLTPCLLKTSETIVCLGNAHEGEALQCASQGLLFEPPYVTSYDSGCGVWTVKDVKGNHFRNLGSKTMSYKEAISDSNPNVQSLGSAMTHIEELLCTAGCSELTMMSVMNNTNIIVDTPVGIWKRKTGSGNQVTQCSTMSTGKIELLTPICTLLGIVGIQHISSSSITYYWDLNQLYATTSQPSCLTETIRDLEPLMKHQDNGTLTMDTFMGRIELNTKTGESRFLSYNPDIVINKKRWFPNVALEQAPPDEKTNDLEISIMQQIRNLSAEYQASCKEAKGPVILKTIGGAVWMLEEDVSTAWGNVVTYFWLWKVAIGAVLIWVGLYICILILGLIRTLFTAKEMIRVPVSYARKRKY